MTVLQSSSKADMEQLSKFLGKNTKRRRSNKYNNKRVYVDDRPFHSQAEADRYLELKALQKAGEISDLKCQWGYDLYAWTPEGRVKVSRYIADFFYVDKTGKEITEDVKGCVTAMYLLKKKMVQANYGIEVVEIKKK